MDTNAVGAHEVGELDKFYRCGALYACARSNIPVDYLFDLGDWLGLHTKESIGHRSNLGKDIVIHLLKTLLEELGLALKNWMSTQQDCASTNKASLKWIKDHKNYKSNTKFSENYCNSHNLSNTGNSLKDSAKDDKEF
eukprot:14299190-Ditylum_brightwellii.AAC.1